MSSFDANGAGGSATANGSHEPLAVLVKRFPRLSETFILNEFLELRRQGLRVELFAVMDPQEAHSQPEALALVPEVTYLQTGPLAAELPRAARTVRRHPWGALKAAAWVLITRRSRAAARHYVHALTLLSHLESRGVAHLHAHFAHTPAAIALLARKIGGLRYSVTGHAKDIYTATPDSLAMRGRGAAFFATCTEANRRHLIEETGLDPDRVLLCRHGVDLARFANLQRAPVPGRILAIGRLVPKKGFQTLIEACAIVARRGHAFDLRIVGSGELRAALEARSRDLGIEDQVTIAPARPQPELLEEFAAAEAFALAPAVQPNGDRDGVPNVLLEAMAAGLPVVSTSVSGIPEVISPGTTGLLVPSADPQALAGALVDLLTDAPLRRRLGAAAQAHVIENFDLARSVQPLVERFRELVAANTDADGRAP